VAEYQQSSLADRLMSRLEEKLPAILQEIEIRAHLSELQRLAEQEKQQQRELDMQRRIAAAKVTFTEAFRASVLDTQLGHWKKARQLNEYIAAMAERIADIEDPEAAENASQWLSWVRTYTERLDPLNAELAMPPDPEPTRAELAPYL
jgi:hypothetical protein